MYCHVQRDQDIKGCLYSDKIFNVSLPSIGQALVERSDLRIEYVLVHHPSICLMSFDFFLGAKDEYLPVLCFLKCSYIERKQLQTNTDTHTHLFICICRIKTLPALVSNGPTFADKVEISESKKEKTQRKNKIRHRKRKRTNEVQNSGNLKALVFEAGCHTKR